jgi:hypothetical protein
MPMKSSFSLLLALVATARADTLTLRNGTQVAGSWLGADNEKISFLTDEMPRTYNRSEVLEVTFSKSAATPAPVISTAPAPAIVRAPQQVVYGPEPEWVGAVYLRDASGKFIPLERNTAMTIQARYPIVYTLNMFAVEGPRSPTRIKASDKVVFVVRLANGVDPRIFTLYAMEANKKGRAALPDKKTRNFKTHLVNVSRVGVSSYGLTPQSALPAGEYCFIPGNSRDAYCFGVDAQ